MSHYYKAIRIAIITMGVIFEIKSQETSFQARPFIDTLCSPYFSGRGYVDNGAEKAASVIQNLFHQWGIEPLSDHYAQTFTFPIHIFPHRMVLKIDEKILEAGKDYIVRPNSRSIDGDFSSVTMNSDLLLDENYYKKLLKTTKGKAVCIFPPSWENDKEKYKNWLKIREQWIQEKNLQAAIVLIFQHEKLTWGLSQSGNALPVIELNIANQFEIQEVEVIIDAQTIANQESKNIIGKIKGLRSDSLLVLTAHYDHLGKMGNKTYFPGANDNASGVALMLSLAEYFLKNPPPFDIIIIAFGAEEVGLLGSSYFVKHPLINLSKIKFLLNFDIAGTGDEGIQIVNSKIFTKEFEILKALNDSLLLLPQIKKRGEACNSDHCPFYLKGVPCFFIYTLGGITAYHDVWDQSKTLPLSEFEDYKNLMIAFISSF